MRPRLFCKNHRRQWQQLAKSHVLPHALAARLTLNTSTWSSRDTSTRVFGAKSWPGGLGTAGDSCPEPLSSASSSLTAASSAHAASCGQKPVRPALRQVPYSQGEDRGDSSGNSRLHGVGVPGPGQGLSPIWAAPQSPGADLCGLCRLPEGQAGTVVPLRVDVSEDSNEEGRWVPLRTQLPPAGLTKLWGGKAQGQQSAPLHPAKEHTQPGPGRQAPSSRQHPPQPPHLLTSAHPRKREEQPVWGEDPVRQDMVPIVREDDLMWAQALCQLS